MTEVLHGCIDMVVVVVVCFYDLKFCLSSKLKAASCVWCLIREVCRGNVTNAAFQSPRANGAHDFEVGKFPVQPYVAFHSRTEPRWLIVLSCSFLLCLLLALINSVNRVFVLQRTHALHTCSCTSLTQQRINLKPRHRAYQHKTIGGLCRVA